MFTNSLVFAAGLIGDLYNPGAMLPTLCKKVVGFFLRINETLKGFIYFKLCFSSQTKNFYIFNFSFEEKLLQNIEMCMTF